MAARERELKALEERLGHVFQDRALLEAALTHVSFAAGRSQVNYQRLEFLGDRVLGLAVSEMLYASFPEADEGELSRRLAALVRKESCAEAALVWGAESCLRLGESEPAGPAARTTILGDVCESLIGAIFLDGGYHAAKAVVAGTFGERMRSPQPPLRDAKTALQEWAQGQGLAPPLYREVDRTGPAHAPEFTVCVEVQGYAGAKAKGSAKRQAEQAAAAAFMARENIGQSKEKGAA